MRGRRGAGTLILLAFCIIVFLVIIGLFQFLAGSLTGTQRLRNAHSVSEAVIESAINEMHWSLSRQLNSYPKGEPSPAVKALFDPSNDDEEDVDLFDLSFAAGDDGPEGLSHTARLLKERIRFGFPATIRVQARVRNWKPLVSGWNVEKQGILEIRASFEVGVLLRSAFHNEKVRVWELRRILFCPPHTADGTAFMALNWNYYLHRFRNYVTQWTRFACERAVAQDYVERAIGQKLGQAMDSNDFFIKIGSARRQYPPGKLDDDLRSQLGGIWDRYKDKSKRLQKGFSANRSQAVEEMKTYLEACSDRQLNMEGLVEIRRRVAALGNETPTPFLENDGLDQAIAKLVPPPQSNYNATAPGVRLYKPQPSATALDLKAVGRLVRELQGKNFYWEGSETMRPVFVKGAKATAGEPLDGRRLSFVNMAQPFDAMGALESGGYDKAVEFARKIRIPPPLNTAAGEDKICLAFGFHKDFEKSLQGGGSGAFDFAADEGNYAQWEGEIRPALDRFTGHCRDETNRHRTVISLPDGNQQKDFLHMARLLATGTARRRATHAFRDEGQYHDYLRSLAGPSGDEVPLCGVYRVDGPLSSVLPAGLGKYTGTAWILGKGKTTLGPVQASEPEKKERDGNLLVQILEGGELVMEGDGEIQASILASRAKSVTFGAGRQRIRGNLVVGDLHGTCSGPTGENERPNAQGLYDCERLDDFEIVYDPALSYRPDGSSFERKELVLVLSPCRSLQFGTVSRK